ncbi:hypothetical protein BpHYR1_054398, partial [Brachionus plicatilis]
ASKLDLNKNGAENGKTNGSVEPKSKPVNGSHENSEEINAAVQKNETKDKLMPNRGYLSPSSDSSDSVFAFNLDKSGLIRQNSTNNVLVSSNDSPKPEFFLDSNSTEPVMNQSKKRSLSPGYDPNVNKKSKEMNYSNSTQALQEHFRKQGELLDSLPIPNTAKLINSPSISVVKNTLRVNISCNKK